MRDEQLEVATPGGKQISERMPQEASRVRPQRRWHGNGASRVKARRGAYGLGAARLRCGSGRSARGFRSRRGHATQARALLRCYELSATIRCVAHYNAEVAGSYYSAHCWSRVRECSTVRSALPFTKASRCCWPASRIGIRLLVASRDAVPASPCSSRVLEGRVLKGRALEGEESSTVSQGVESRRPHGAASRLISDGDPTGRSIERCCACKLLLRGSIGQHRRAPLEPLRVSTAEAPGELRPRP